MTIDTAEAADQLLADLHALGPNEQLVADALRRSGVKGYRESCTGCPVAEYLKGRGWPLALVDLTGITVTAGESGTAVGVIVPSPVARFIEDFDAGAWPDLSLGIASPSSW